MGPAPISSTRRSGNADQRPRQVEHGGDALGDRVERAESRAERGRDLRQPQKRPRVAGGIGVGRFRGDGLELAAVADAGDVQHCGARLAGTLEHLHRIPRAAGVAQDDDAVLRVDRSLVRRQVSRMRRLGLDARFAQHPRPLLGRVPTRPDADQQQPAARQPRGGHPGRFWIGKQPRELLRLRPHGIAHL